MQRTIGNQTIQRMLEPGGEAADAAAEGDGRRGLRRCACGGTIGSDGQCDRCRAQRVAMKSANPPSQTPTIPSIVRDVLKGGEGRPLDSATRLFMESRFGRDLGNVRVHTDNRAGESAHALNALAYTHGGDIVFGRERYAPGTSDGLRLLAHELTHVVQQGAAGQPGNGGAALERQADVSAGSTLQVLPAHDPLEGEADRVAARVLEGFGAEAPSMERSEPAIARQGDQPADQGTAAPPAPTPEPFPGAAALAKRSKDLEGEIAKATARWADAMQKQDLPWKDIINLKLNIATVQRERLLIDTYFANGWKDGKLDDTPEKVIQTCHDAAQSEEQTLVLLQGHPSAPGEVSEIVKDALLKMPELFPDHVVGLYRSAEEEFTSKSQAEAARAVDLVTPLVSRPPEEIAPDLAWMLENEDLLRDLSTLIGFIVSLDDIEPVLLEKKDPNSTKLGIDDIRVRVNEVHMNVGAALNPTLGARLGFLYPILEAYYFYAFYQGLAETMHLFRISVEANYERLNEPFSSPDVLKDLERTYNNSISIIGGSLVSVSQVAPSKMREGYAWISQQFERVLDAWVTDLSEPRRIWEGFAYYDASGEIGRALKAMFTLENILKMVGFTALMIALQFVPFGNLIADAIVIGLIGTDVLEGIVILATYFDAAADATTFRGLFRSAKYLAGAGTVALSLLLQFAMLAAGRALGSYLKYRRGLRIKDVDEIANDPAITEGPPAARKLVADAQGSIKEFKQWEDTLPADAKTELDNPSNSGLRKIWAEMDPLVRRILTRCGSACIPRNATELQAGQIKSIVNKFGITAGSEWEGLLREYFHSRRDVLQGAIDEAARAPTLEALEAVARESPVVPAGTPPAIVPRIHALLTRFTLSVAEQAMLREFFQVNAADLEAALAQIEPARAKSDLVARLRRASTARAPAAPGTSPVPRTGGQYSHAIGEHGAGINPENLMNRAKTKPNRATGGLGLQQGQWYNDQLIVETDQRFPGVGIGDGVDVDFGRPVGRVYLPDGLVISDVRWVRVIRNPDGSFFNAFPVLAPGTVF